MGGFRRFSHRLAAVAAVALLAGIHPHLISSRAAGAEGASVVRGTVKDMDGTPLEGVEVGMSPIGKESKPYVVKTRNDGTFVYPFLPYNKQKYSVEFKKEGYKVRKIKIVSRQPQTSADKGEGQLIQEDEGTVGPQQQIPPVNAKPGGTVHIEIAMASREYLDKLAQAQADAASGSQPPSGSSAPGTPQQRGGVERKLDPIEEAQQLASDRKFDEATEVLKKSIQEQPTAEKWFALGKVRTRADDPEGAKSALARAAALDPQLRGAHFLLGKLYSDEGRTSEAIAEMDKERALGPDDTNTLRALGILYMQGGRKDDAIKLYERMTAQPNADPELMARLAGLYGATGNYPKAEAIYRKILESNPGEADAVYLKLGRAIMNQSNVGEDDRKRAADAFQRALEVNPSNARAHLDLAYVLLGLGDVAQAKEHMKKFLELQPNGPEAASVRTQLKELG